MPIYDYICLDCHKKFDLQMSYSEYGVKPVVCPRCAGSNVRRRINRIRVARSEESRLDRLADPSALSGLDEDPRALGKMMREMGKESGEDLGPDFDEVVGRLESGQDPDGIENDMPGLASSMPDDGDLGF